MSTNARSTHRTITDPVVMFDSMWEAANSLFGSLLWLSDHAESRQIAEEWWQRALGVDRERAAVPPDDLDAQWDAMLAFRRQERELEPLINP